jgi:phospholipase C
MRIPRVVGVLGLVALFVVSSLGPVQAQPTSPAKTQLAQFDAHISHIVFLMQENHAYDSIYGEYCLITGKYCYEAGDGLPATTCVPLNPSNASWGCAKPFNFSASQVSLPDMEHDWYSDHAAWNNGAMNNFYLAESNYNTFGHYNGSTVPFYWDLAEQYGLADDFFSGDASYSLPNHWDIVSASPPVASQQNYLYAGSPVQAQYLNESNHTLSIESELLNSSVSWKYYDYGLPPYPGAIGNVPGVPATAYDYWNPLAARAQSYTPHVKTHFVPRTDFFGDAKNGTLPNLSWIIPTAGDSDHPGASSITVGQQWVASVVDALESSPEWNSTVLFISWDEYGGFYDQVAPPYLNAVSSGFRVPLLVVGPWVRQGYIDHTQMVFDSVLHLMEERFNLSCLGALDCNAKLPLGMFNFQRSSPRPPIGYATNATWTYPMPLQSSGKLPYFGPNSTWTPIYQATGYGTAGPAIPGVINLS